MVFCSLPDTGYQGCADSSRESELRGPFCRKEGEKSQEYFVYFKILRQTCGEKRPQSADAGMDQRLPGKNYFPRTTEKGSEPRPEREVKLSEALTWSAIERRASSGMRMRIAEMIEVWL